MGGNNRLFKQLILPAGILASAFALAGISWSISQKQKDVPERSIEFNEKITVPVPKGSKNVRIWIPVPGNDFYQRAELLSLESPCSYRITEEKDFGNRMIYLEPKSPIKGDAIEISAFYKIIRKEQRGLEAEKDSSDDVKTAILPSDYLSPRGLEIINDKIGKISEEATRGINDPMVKARAIYKYVLNHMRYDKSGTDWGRGDSIYACDVGRGNCTDFHSLFIALARASRIPARFQMGISLPESPEGEPSGAYHCWAEFYIEGKGWIPVDISEAWKNPQKAEYFFGHLDVHRICLSTGREIELSPKQKGAPLNYLSKPYIEINGKPFNDFKLERHFKNI